MLLTTTSLFQALCLIALQAGGGGSFGSGGGGSGDGEGIGYLFYFLIRLVMEAPLIGIPVLIVVVIVMYKGSRKGASSLRRNTIRRGADSLLAGRNKSLEAEVRASDEAFDGDRFSDRVTRGFTKIQEAWCAQDLSPVQHFVSDGVHERFSLQIAEQKEEGWRQGMDGLRVQGLALVQFDRGLHFETLTVRISFAASIYRKDLRNGERIRASELSRSNFEECWSFVRRKGTRSLTSAGLIEGQCPNCAAPLAIRQAGSCETCGAHVRSGEFDWILTEITQASEWRAETEQRVPGMIEYAESDPGLSVQLLEDRASLAFWRKCAAERQGNAEPLVRLATEGFLSAFTGLIEALPGRDRFYIAENAVGSVRTVGILPGEKRDRAIVEVLSDGCRAEVDDKGRRKVESVRRLQRVLYVFERQAGRTTRLKETFTTALCQNCGAHDSGGRSPRCPYCEAPRTGDPDAWLLADVVIDRTPAALDLRSELQAGQVSTPADKGSRNENSTADLLAWAGALVRADGRVDGRERMALQALAERLGVSNARLEEVLEEGGDGSAVREPRDTLEARDWMRSLLRLALEGGTVPAVEWRLLKSAAKRFGIGRVEFERLLRQEERELARATRAAN
jgi:hypothetical protein